MSNLDVESVYGTRMERAGAKIVNSKRRSDGGHPSGSMPKNLECEFPIALLRPGAVLHGCTHIRE